MAHLFISYARADGRTLADRLAVDLKARNHDPWLDRSEIQTGDAWSRTIEEAIDRCEALLAVLTPGSFKSTICRGEQLRALRVGKRVLPLLAQKSSDRPVYLEAAHYLDFSDPATYESQLTGLLDHIVRAGGVGLGDIPTRYRERIAKLPLDATVRSDRGRYDDWKQVLSTAVEQCRRFFEGLSPRRGAAGIFEPDLYVPRTREERELDRFLAGDDIALILLGNSGVGKTNLLCHWAVEQADAGNAVLMYDCDRLDVADVDRAIAGDFGIDDSPLPAVFLRQLDDFAGREGRRLLLVLDGLNDFRGPDHEGPEDLLGSVDSLVARLPGVNLRVVLSCSTPTWNRIERLEQSRLTWKRYYRTERDEDTLLLEGFDAEQTERAYDLYRARFQLARELTDLPLALRVRVHEPLFLRLLAEVMRGQPAEGWDRLSDATLFNRYYEERVRRREDKLFLEELAGEMWTQESAALPVLSLSDNPKLGPSVVSEDADTSYGRLLDDGLVMEVAGDLFNDDLLKFTYPVVGASALVQWLSRRNDKAGLDETLRQLAEKARKLSIAWDAAVILLAVRGDSKAYASLAEATDPELRELATESLVWGHGQDPKKTRDFLTSLLDSDNADRQRTALRAAFNIGPATRDLLVRSAMSKSPTLQQAVRDTLYLIWSGASRSAGESRARTVYFIWRHAPDFTYELMRELVARARWYRPREAGRILRFVLDLSITIYVNHCEREDVTGKTADVFHELTVERLHLDRLNPGRHVERYITEIVSGVFSQRVLDWMLLADLESPEEFFRLPSSDRSVLADVAPFLDPARDLKDAEELLLGMLGSNVSIFRGAASLVMVVHACSDFAACEGMYRRFFDALDAEGRMWLLIGFSVLLPETPREWVPLLEELTGRFLREHPDLASGRAGFLKAFDVLFVPLGGAYGKKGGGMPLIAEWLAAAIASGDHGGAARLVSGLGVVGFYHPHAVLDTLRPHVEPLLAQPVSRDALISALATVRTLHFDPVDSFLLQAGVDETVRRQVAASTDLALVNRFVSLLGYTNNAVHYCLHYPRMRRGLGMRALELLAQSSSARDFVAEYAWQAIRMARDAGFQLLEWTKRD
jgi:hypothetical protein